MDRQHTSANEIQDHTHQCYHRQWVSNIEWSNYRAACARERWLRRKRYRRSSQMEKVIALWGNTSLNKIDQQIPLSMRGGGLYLIPVWLQKRGTEPRTWTNETTWLANSTICTNIHTVTSHFSVGNVILTKTLGQSSHVLVFLLLSEADEGDQGASTTGIHKCSMPTDLFAYSECKCVKLQAKFTVWYAKECSSIPGSSVTTHQSSPLRISWPVLPAVIHLVGHHKRETGLLKYSAPEVTNTGRSRKTSVELGQTCS